MLNRRALLFALLAVALGLGGAYVNYEWLKTQTFQPLQPVKQLIEGTIPEAVTVVTANADLAVGEPIRDGQITTVNWPKDLIPPGALLAESEADGRIPRRPVAKGEPILETALLPQGSAGGLSPIIGEGRRAVAVKVDEVIGIAGFVTPGAHVDVLATISERGRSNSSFSKVILQDVNVLAVDQTLEQVNGGDPKLVSVVTLEVTPAEAQKLTYAAHQGELQLALRNPSDDKVVRTSSVSSSTLRGYPSTGSSRKVEIIKGLKVSSKSF